MAAHTNGDTFSFLVLPEINLRYSISSRFGALEVKAYFFYFSIMAVLKKYFIKCRIEAQRAMKRGHFKDRSFIHEACSLSCSSELR